MKKIVIMVLSFLSIIVISVLPISTGFDVTDGEGNRLKFIGGTDELTVGWRHSVEKTPWRETYHVGKDGQLALAYTDYKMYGAGTPDGEGKTELLPDGMIRVTGIERTVPYYSLFYVPISQYSLEVDGESYPLEEFAPAYEEIRISFEKVRLYEWLLMGMPHFLTERRDIYGDESRRNNG